MSETLVTVTGNVATVPDLRTTSSGAQVARFRVAATERRYDRAIDRWSDAHTNFFTVWAWRALGENVMASLGVGDPVIVQGKLRVTEREEQGRTFLSASIDAVAVGHDLNRGMAAFRRITKNKGDWASDPFAMPAGAVAPGDPAPPADGVPRSVPGVPAPAGAMPDELPGEAPPSRPPGRRRTAPAAARAAAAAALAAAQPPAEEGELVPF